MVGRAGLEKRRIVWITSQGSVRTPSTDGNRKPGAPKGQCSRPTKVRAVTWAVTGEELRGSGWEVGRSRKTAKQGRRREKQKQV